MIRDLGSAVEQSFLERFGLLRLRDFCLEVLLKMLLIFPLVVAERALGAIDKREPTLDKRTPRDCLEQGSIGFKGSETLQDGVCVLCPERGEACLRVSQSLEITSCGLLVECRFPS